ncbi:multifunctional CCA addition/repair protein [Uliginosibacterium gangwonense]|uniref:multifunctional CCA addition/repair protein n=1 Tax=Uliginosibacterium gangwonense TaxID=392736 RepID=UPI0003765FDA|nr:multifunctional CCA addition/repair protein [Uliginosibacterium gangwonense]
MDKSFKIYIVGGAVRDRLLGLPIQDRDWVVVGASPDDMLAAGFRPVGKDFPVFLHPQTQEEYALARTERKTAPGYKGFVFHTDPEVRLEDDLIRRDLTINAMAEDDAGALIDPFGGQRDLEQRVFRHVSPAFMEDPVRILRLARFAARFPDFSVAPETLALMREMVANGEIDHLVPERVWQEISRGLMYARPSRMIEVLRECGALARLMPELDCLFGIPQPAQHHPEVDTGAHVLRVIDYAAAQNEPLPVRWAALLHDLGKGDSPPEQWPHHYGHEQSGVVRVEAVCTRLKVPVDCRDLAVLTCREHGSVHKASEMRASTLTSFLERTDALRRPARLEGLLAAASCDFHGRQGFEDQAFAAPALIRRALAAFTGVDAGELARNLEDKSQIPARLHEARSQAIRQALGLDADTHPV